MTNSSFRKNIFLLGILFLSSSFSTAFSMQNYLQCFCGESDVTNSDSENEYRFVESEETGSEVGIEGEIELESEEIQEPLEVDSQGLRRRINQVLHETFISPVKRRLIVVGATGVIIIMAAGIYFSGIGSFG